MYLMPKPAGAPPHGTPGWKRLTQSGHCNADRVAFNAGRLSMLAVLCSIGLTGHATAQTADKEQVDDTTAIVPSNLSMSVGGSIWTGDFGADSDTTIKSALFGARYQTGSFRLSANFPYMDIRSKGSFFAGIDGTPLFVAPGVAPSRRNRTGWGDVTLGASYLLPSIKQLGLDVDITGRIKIPIASGNSQLSTGKVDYAIGAAVSKTVGRFTPSVSATYRIYGDNRSWQFRDGANVTVGGAYAVNDRTIVVVNYDYARAASRLIADAHAGVVGLSTKVGQRFRLTGFASKGFSDGAAAFSGGASLSMNF